MNVQVKEILDKAEALSGQGRFQEAHDICVSVLNANPDIDRAVTVLGNIAAATGQPGIAVNLYERALSLSAQNITAMMNLGPALNSCGKPDKAERIYKILDEVLSDPDANQAFVKQLAPEMMGNWSGLYVNAGKPDKGLPITEKGLKVNPLDPGCNNHKALMLMELGRWSEAWPHWERRLDRKQFHVRQWNVPYWDGTPTDCLAIHGEQGIGDEVMFASCVEEAKKIAKKVVIECQDRLVPIFSRSFGVECYPSPELLYRAHGPQLTAKVAFGSLLSLLRKSPQDCPGVPYIKPEPQLVREYKGRIAAMGPGLKVGIAWRGGTGKTHERVRKVPLNKWKPILDIPNVRFISLQYGPDAAFEADENGVTHWSVANADIDRQMALISACDLVISVCQSAVHFAGALGKETWCLTPSAPRWCYGLTGETMAFYKSVRLLRQAGDWKEVIDHVAGELTFRAKKVAA